MGRLFLWFCSGFWINIWGFPEIGGSPKWMVYKGKSFLNGWWLGVPLFQETTTRVHIISSCLAFVPSSSLFFVQNTPSKKHSAFCGVIWTRCRCFFCSDIRSPHWTGKRGFKLSCEDDPKSAAGSEWIWYNLVSHPVGCNCDQNIQVKV